MRRMSIVVPIVVMLTVAGCGSSAAQAGAGGLDTAPSSGPTTGATHTTTTAAPTNTSTATTSSTKKPTGTSGWPSPADCVSYDPSTVTVDGSGGSGTFVVSAGSTVVMRLHGQDDQVGVQALALAQRYREHCYIGRSNTRDPKGDYIFDYWRDASGQTPTIPGEDQACREYNNQNLTVEDMGDGNGWRVKDHDDVLHVFDNGTDARNADIVFLKYGQICSIGSSLDSDRDLGQVTYLK